MSNALLPAQNRTPKDSSLPSVRASTPRRTWTFLFLFSLALLVVSSVLLPGLDNGLVSDDWVFVYQGLTVHDSPEPFIEIPRDWFSRPILWLLANDLAGRFGSDPRPYRVAAFGVHLLNALLLTLFAWRLSDLLRDPRPAQADHASDASNTVSSTLGDPRRIFSLAVGSLFFVYSLHHEVLYWFSAISESLAFLFRLLALVLLTALLGATSRFSRTVGSILTATLAGGILTTAALASKESAAILPAELTLVLIMVSWYRRSVGPRSSRPALGSSLGLLAGSGLVTASWLVWYLQMGATRTQLTLLELGPVDWILRLGQGGWRALCFGRAPHDLYLIVGFLLGWFGLLVAAIWRRHASVVFASLWLAFCLLPYVAITSVSDRDSELPVLLRQAGLIGDRYYYGAGAALALLLCGAVLWLVDELEPRLPSARSRPLVWGAALAFLAGVASVHLARLLILERGWDKAGEIVREVQAELHAKLEPMEKGDLICVLGRPDNYQGRFVLRSGIAELIRLEAGFGEVQVFAPPFVEGAPCTQRIELERHEGVVPTD